MTDATPTWGDTALIVAVPEAEPVVSDLRLAHDSVAEHGVPAHVTVLFPFVPLDGLTAAVRAAAAEVFSRIPQFEYRFTRVGRFGDTTVFLRPEPAAAFRALIDAAAARWPEHPPYGGVIDDVIPHLTVGDGLTPDIADALEAKVAVRLTQNGSLVGRVTEVALLVQGSDGRWSVDDRYALATPS